MVINLIPNLENWDGIVNEEDVGGTDESQNLIMKMEKQSAESFQLKHMYLNADEEKVDVEANDTCKVTIESSGNEQLQTESSVNNSSEKSNSHEQFSHVLNLNGTVYDQCIFTTQKTELYLLGGRKLFRFSI